MPHQMTAEKALNDASDYILNKSLEKFFNATDKRVNTTIRVAEHTATVKSVFGIWELSEKRRINPLYFCYDGVSKLGFALCLVTDTMACICKDGRRRVPYTFDESSPLPSLPSRRKSPSVNDIRVVLFKNDVESHAIMDALDEAISTHVNPAFTTRFYCFEKMTAFIESLVQTLLREHAQGNDVTATLVPTIRAWVAANCSS